MGFGRMLIVSLDRKNDAAGELIGSIQHGRCRPGGSPWAVHYCLADGSGAVHCDQNGFSYLNLGASDVVDWGDWMVADDGGYRLDQGRCGPPLQMDWSCWLWATVDAPWGDGGAPYYGAPAVYFDWCTCSVKIVILGLE
ncbi:hypothetical protein ACLOJK_023102 [Asimina triloba]